MSSGINRVAHRFLRQPNHQSSIYSRIGNRHDPFKNTLAVLEDPKAARKLYLIGTTNSSTTLAYRTQKLIQSVKPTSVYVQTFPQWWNYAKHLNISTQQQMNCIINEIPKQQSYRFENNLRGIIFRTKLFTWTQAMKFLHRFPNDFNFFKSGLETKIALHEAENIGSQTVFGGSDFDEITIEQLRNQSDMFFVTPLWKARKFINTLTARNSEYNDFYNTLFAKGASSFAESIDRFRINYMVSLLNQVAPKQKKILIDSRDQRIFRDLYTKCKGETIVAVINQWHMEGVETHWRRATGTQVVKQNLSPVADMDIDSYQQIDAINDFLRQYVSKRTKSEPATWQNFLFNYHKENYENQRTRKIHHSSHQEIPNPGEQKKTSHH